MRTGIVDQIQREPQRWQQHGAPSETSSCSEKQQKLCTLQFTPSVSGQKPAAIQQDLHDLIKPDTMLELVQVVTGSWVRPLRGNERDGEGLEAASKTVKSASNVLRHEPGRKTSGSMQQQTFSLGYFVNWKKRFLILKLKHF